MVFSRFGRIFRLSFPNLLSAGEKPAWLGGGGRLILVSSERGPGADTQTNRQKKTSKKRKKVLKFNSQKTRMFRHLRVCDPP